MPSCEENNQTMLSVYQAFFSLNNNNTHTFLLQNCQVEVDSTRSLSYQLQFQLYTSQVPLSDLPSPISVKTKKYIQPNGKKIR